MTKRNIFATALFIYLFLAAFTYHPDIKTIFYQTQFLTKGVFNIYSFFAANPEKAYLGPFVYPPLAYFLYGIFFIPVKLIAGSGFVQWLGMGNDAVGVTHIFRYLFALKIPAIVIHFISAFVITGFFQDKSLQKKALLFWFFNPVSIYVVVFMGQIDAMAVLLSILALFYANKKPLFSSFLLGLGGAIKTYPLLLIPYLAIIAGSSWKRRALNIAIGFAAYLIFVMPFLKTPAFFSSTFVSGLSQRLFEARILLGYGENILIIPVILLILFFVTIGKTFTKPDIKFLWVVFLAITLTVVTGVHFHPQWMLWCLPFITLYFVKNINSFKGEVWFISILFLIGWLGTIIFFDDKFLTWGIISPLDNGILLLPTLSQIIKPIFDPLLIQSLFHTLLIASGAGMIYRCFKENV